MLNEQIYLFKNKIGEKLVKQDKKCKGLEGKVSILHLKRNFLALYDLGFIDSFWIFEEMIRGSLILLRWSS